MGPGLYQSGAHLSSHKKALRSKQRQGRCIGVPIWKNSKVRQGPRPRPLSRSGALWSSGNSRKWRTALPNSLENTNRFYKHRFEWPWSFPQKEEADVRGQYPPSPAAAMPFRLASPPAPRSVRCPCCAMVIPIAIPGKPKNLPPKHLCEHHRTRHGHPLYDHTSIARMKHLVALCGECGSAYCPGSTINHLAICGGPAPPSPPPPTAQFPQRGPPAHIPISLPISISTAAPDAPSSPSAPHPAPHTTPPGPTTPCTYLKG